MYKLFVVLVLVLQSVACVDAEAQGVWAGKDGNIRNIDTRGLVTDKGALYLATRNEVYVATDPNDKWEPVFALPQGENEISCIAGRSKHIYIGTRRGLYRTDDRGKIWKNVFRSILPDKSNVLALSVSKDNPAFIVIGTEKGVFLSTDYGSSWTDISGTLKNSRVKCVLLDKDVIYAGGNGGFYTSSGLAGNWERSFVKITPERGETSGTSEGAEYESEEDGDGVSCIAITDARVYVGVGKDLFSTSDGGKTWAKVPGGGLSGSINYIASPSKSDLIYCATTKGVFEYEKDKDAWRELYKGFDKVVNITSLTIVGDDEKSLWASTDQGLYRLESGRYVSDNYIDVEKGLKNLKIVFDNEPPFAELRKAAIDYADVNPEKIKNWQSQSRLKALAPKVSLGWDKNVSNTYEIYTSATKDYVTSGPDDIASGMDVSVSWDIAGLIWSDDQTNIDVRSRLMVQLRNDILDDLRRAYYERKRLQFDIMANPPKDMKSKFDKEARIQELTQNIDDLTENYFSKHMKK
ncbi:MAG: hypothetical protein NTZ95_05875 [Candidatus Omnitrophica bacterium]|nr:hypothetical protein [Candidatus Omnitrophota bacterium]